MLGASPEKLQQTWRDAAEDVKGNFFEFVIERLIERFCAGARCMIDVGANCGAHTFTMLKVSKGKVFAFEANPKIASCLDAWVPKHPNLSVLPIALSDRAGTAEFLIATAEGYSALARHRRPQVEPMIEKTITVTTAALDDFTEFRRELPVSFIKVDIEGAEVAFLHGAAETLKHATPLVVVEMDWASCLPTDQDVETKFFRFLNDVGYGVYSFLGQELTKRSPDCWNVILVPRVRGRELPRIRKECLSAADHFFRSCPDWNPYKKFEVS